MSYEEDTDTIRGGTGYFVSPEKFSQMTYNERGNDVWGLAATLLQLFNPNGELEPAHKILVFEVDTCKSMHVSTSKTRKLEMVVLGMFSLVLVKHMTQLR